MATVNVALKKATEVQSEIIKLERSISEKIRDEQNQLNTLKEQDKDMREQLMLAMQKNNVKTIENDLIKVTFVSEQTRSTVDIVALKQAKPEIAEMFKKESKVKPSIRIKVKDADNNN